MYIFIYYGDNIENIKIYINEEKLNFSLVGNYNKMINLGKFEEKEKVKVEFELKEDELIIEDEYIYYEDEKILEECYDILNNEQMDIKEINGRRYEGDINIESENEYILFTLPYDDGWQIMVDGEKVDKIKVQDSLMAIEIGKGKHKINLKFVPKGILTGCVLSISGIVLLIISIMITIQRKDKSSLPFV